MTATATVATEVIVHPLVLLSTVDHYTRLNTGVVAGKRVVGVLLGQHSHGVMELTNSFAVPFEEDPKDSSIWYFDHNYLENMFAMFKKVAAREKILGWYSTGPKLKPNDLAIHAIFRKYHPSPVYVIIEAEPKGESIPAQAYVAVETLEDESSQPKLMFRHISASIAASSQDRPSSGQAALALEAEEIGVEHLLRDVTDSTVSTLSTQVTDKITALRELGSKLSDIKEYLSVVVAGKLPVNHSINYKLQEIFNILPLLHLGGASKEVCVEINDQLMITYTASIVRTIVALHNLITNKMDLKKQKDKDEKEKERKAAEEKQKKDKEKEDKEKEKEKDGASDEKTKATTSKTDT